MFLLLKLGAERFSMDYFITYYLIHLLFKVTNKIKIKNKLSPQKLKNALALYSYSCSMVGQSHPADIKDRIYRIGEV